MFKKIKTLILLLFSVREYKCETSVLMFCCAGERIREKNCRGQFCSIIYIFKYAFIYPLKCNGVVFI